MAMPIELPAREATVEERIRRLQKTEPERDELLRGAPVCDYDAWARAVGTATPEELSEQEEFLRERDRERQRSLTREQAEQPA